MSFLTSNLTKNTTSSNRTRSYVFLPIDVNIRLSLYIPAAAFGLYAIIANGLILYLKNSRAGRSGRGLRAKSFSRSQVTGTFIQSLAISDFTCGLIMLPLAIVTNFVDIIDNDFKCRAVRFCNLFFPSVTILNLFVIGMERCLAVFYPFRVPSLRGVRIMVVLAWITGGVITVMPTVTFNVKTVNHGKDHYFLDCVNDNTKPTNKILFIGYTVIIYVIPALILFYINIRIVLALRKRKRTITQLANASKYNETSVFVTLIFTFILPYFLFVAFSAVRIIVKPRFNFTTDYFIRRLNAVLAYSNSAISPTVMIFSMRRLRKGVKDFVVGCCGDIPITEEFPSVPRANVTVRQRRGGMYPGHCQPLHLHGYGLQPIPNVPGSTPQGAHQIRCQQPPTSTSKA